MQDALSCHTLVDFFIERLAWSTLRTRPPQPRICERDQKNNCMHALCMFATVGICGWCIASASFTAVLRRRLSWLTSTPMRNKVSVRLSARKPIGNVRWDEDLHVLILAKPYRSPFSKSSYQICVFEYTLRSLWCVVTSTQWVCNTGGQANHNMDQNDSSSSTRTLNETCIVPQQYLNVRSRFAQYNLCTECQELCIATQDCVSIDHTDASAVHVVPTHRSHRIPLNSNC